MKIDHRDIEERYRAMIDREFVLIHPDDLTADARAIYEREREHRSTPGYAPPQAVPQEAPQATKVDLLGRAFSAQRDAVKTPRNLMRGATMMLIFGIVIWGVLILVEASGGRLGKIMGDMGWLGVVGLVVFVIMLCSPLLALYQFGLVLFRPRRRVACPFCGATHSIFHGVQSYICTGCGHILRFSLTKGNASLLESTALGSLVAVQCPRCGTEWGSDAGKNSCFSCGIPLIVRDGTVEPVPPNARCPRCNAETHTGSYLCGACGELISEPEALSGYAARNLFSVALPPVRSDGMDAISLLAMPAIGRIIEAYWEARKGCFIIDALKGKPPGWAAQWKVVVAFTNCLIHMNILSQEMPETTAAALGLRSAIQARYARLLVGAVDSATGRFCNSTLTSSGDFAALNEYKVLLEQLSNAEAEQRALLSATLVAWVVPAVAAGQGKVVTENATAVRRWAEAAAGAPGSSPEPIRIPLQFFKHPAQPSV